MALTASPRRRDLGRDRQVLWHHLDVGLIGIVLTISLIGVVVVFSATRGPATDLDPVDTSFVSRQVLFLLVAVAAMAVTAAFDYRRLRSLVPVAYGGLIVLLVGVLLVAPTINGIQAWYQVGGVQIQPSEFGKVILIVTLAAYFSAVSDVDIRRLAVGLVIAGVPMLLIYRQPDLGTILVYVAVTAGIVLLSGVRPRHLAAVLLGALLLIGAGLASNQLETYQLARFSAFLDETPEDEAGQNARFNVEQAQIAIGNGGLTGTGLFEGSQTRSELVSEQQTDFIFTVVAEELGFAGSATLLALFALLLMRIWRIAQVAQDMFGALICMGVFSMLLFHVFQSVGMTLGMMPVTGIPLPFVSYGGSSLIAMFVAVGLVLNVNMHRYS
ncbi:MAG: rod shape-determining protein RodA [Acidimicrobiia bacterium]|nr:rod shape-determining protein RodA [Acidimicrobiia bacterium]